jgi:hypothetical protein
MEKVIVLSLFRTATQSTKQFLEDLGYKTTHGIDSLDQSKQTLSREELFFELGGFHNNFDAFTDMPYHSMFEYFDNKYPGSKFILITRDLDSWIKSVRKLYDFFENKTFNAPEQFVYNKYFTDCPKDRSECTNEVLTELYNSHIFAVSKYFSDKDNLITIDLSDQDKETKIINFLGITDPELVDTKMQHIDFYKNMTKEKWKEYINQWAWVDGVPPEKIEYPDFLQFINS